MVKEILRFTLEKGLFADFFKDSKLPEAIGCP